MNIKLKNLPLEYIKKRDNDSDIQNKEVKKKYSRNMNVRNECFQ